MNITELRPSRDDRLATNTMSFDKELIYWNLQSLLSSRGISLDNLDLGHKEVLKLGQEFEGCWIAGGAPLSLYRGTFDQIKDWDLFFDSNESRAEAQVELLNHGFQKSAETEWSTSYEKNGVIAQTIRHANFDSVESIFESFDLSVCCFAIGENYITFTKQAQEDVQNMVVNFTQTTNPVWCLNRIVKYAMKGFKLTNKSSAEFLIYSKKFKTGDIRKNVRCGGTTPGES